MVKRLLDIYKIYFLISCIISTLLILANLGSAWYVYVLILLGSFLTPFLYELDFVLYAYILDPESEVSRGIKNLIVSKNYSGAFLYAHEHSANFENAVLRSVLMVIGVFAVGFLLLFSFSNYFAISIILTYLLTSLYLQTLSFATNSWRAWYAFFDFVPKEKFAKGFLIIQYFVFLIFIIQIFN
jgi:hypothetical protein